jgi:hypothetical protein
MIRKVEHQHGISLFPSFAAFWRQVAINFALVLGGIAVALFTAWGLSAFRVDTRLTTQISAVVGGLAYAIVLVLVLNRQRIQVRRASLDTDEETEQEIEQQVIAITDMLGYYLVRTQGLLILGVFGVLTVGWFLGRLDNLQFIVAYAVLFLMIATSSLMLLRINAITDSRRAQVATWLILVVSGLAFLACSFVLLGSFVCQCSG